ncbi:MAG: hypothetical protein PHQ65_11980 [Bacteroidales bacterium]|nr:hypothetical protein [Bacteroidales bacterium]MDD3665976.1 hypothetical protein [Bacteroidales bacterium]
MANKSITKQVTVVRYNPATMSLTYTRGGRPIGGLRGSVAERTFFKHLESGMRIEFTTNN